MVDFFIKRPIFATVCALLIILAGAVSIPGLPISLYPDLAPPQVTVTSNYVGANAQVVESAVTIPLEQQINGVEGMHYITSTSSNDGTSNINVTFRTGYDLNIAAVDVQNRVATAQGRLPQEIKNTGVTITKANPNFVFAAGFYSPDNSLSNQYISNYLDVYVKDALKRIPGVGDVVIFGERKYAMRIWLDPTKVGRAAVDRRRRGLVLCRSRTSKYPPDSWDARPPIRSRAFQVTLRVVGRLSEPREFESIIIKNTRNGIVQLKDVGRAEIGAESYDTNLLYSGHEAVGVGVQQLSNANALEVDKSAKAALDRAFEVVPSRHQVRRRFRHHHRCRRLRERSRYHAGRSGGYRYHRDFFLPAGLARHDYSRRHHSRFAHRHFCFHQRFSISPSTRSRFLESRSPPGLVVDDAIVVIENAQRHINEDKTDSATATSVAMKEVSSAVVATSLVLISVFVPVSFFPGTTGILYRQFSLTIAFSIAISLFNALTLSPALAALLLRGEEAQILGTRLDPYRTGFPADTAKVAHGIDNAIHGVGRRLRQSHLQGAELSLRHDRVCSCSGWLLPATCTCTFPLGLCLQEDQNYFIVVVQAPQGASLSYTTNVAKQAEQILRADPDVFGTFAVPGFSLTGGSSSNYGLIFAPLKPIDERKGKGHAASEIVARIAPKLFAVPGAIVAAFEPPAIQGIGSFGGFQFELQDLGRNTLQDIDTVAHKIVSRQPPAARICADCSPASPPTIRSNWCRSIARKPRPSECRSVRSRRLSAFTWDRNM